MISSISKVVAVLGSMLVSSMAFAQGGDASSAGLTAIGSGLAIGAAALGATLGQGKTAGAAMEGIARNPNAKDALFTPFIIGLAFMETQALLGFVIAFLLIG